jgi:protein-S-isoprenylcysteine O-methyltransferase Ste14
MADLNSILLKRTGQILGQIGFTALVLFISAGTLKWPMAWVYLAFSLVNLVINGVFLTRYNPQVIAERAERKEGRKSWDAIFTSLYVLIGIVGLMVVAGLDFRFTWTQPYSLGIHLIALVLMQLSGLLFLWAMISNKFFATDVVVQPDRSHTVANSGPYNYVRHPGYVGLITGLLTTPLLLGSLWAMVPGGIGALVILLRTGFEDRTLRKELAGYENYAQQVRFRLVPGIW